MFQGVCTVFHISFSNLNFSTRKSAGVAANTVNGMLNHSREFALRLARARESAGGAMSSLHTRETESQHEKHRPEVLKCFGIRWDREHQSFYRSHSAPGPAAPAAPPAGPPAAPQGCPNADRAGVESMNFIFVMKFWYCLQLRKK